MVTFLTGESPGDQLPVIDPAYRRLAQAVLVQAILDASQIADPEQQQEARNFLFSADCAAALETWKMLAGIPPHLTIDPAILDHPETARRCARVCGKLTKKELL